MITKNSKVLLTIQLEGRLGTTVSNTSSREVKNKVMASPFETISEQGKLITPKNHFKSNDLFKPRSKTSCVLHTTIYESAVAHMISESSAFYPYEKSWKKMSQMDRLKLHLSQIAGGKDFTFEVLN